MNLLPREEILDATDLVALIGERVPLRKQGKEFVGLCPFHPDKKPSMYVNPAKGIFKCFACGAGGDALKFVQLYDKLDFKQALEMLAQRAGIDLRGRNPAASANDRRREDLRRAVAWARTHFQRNLRDTPGGRAACDYALRRGMTAETIEKFGLGYAPDAWDDLAAAGRKAGLPVETLEAAGLVGRNDAGRVYDRFRNRLIFPIHDTFGRPIAFGGRTLGDDPAKYLNSPESALFSKSRVLYGLDLARKVCESRKSVIVVEGYVDAVMLSQAGFEHTVATLGTALTDAHARMLKPYVETVYLCFDGDEAGQKAADRACEVALRSGVDVRVVLLPGGEDPADVVGRDDNLFNNHLQSAKSALHFKWDQTAAGYAAGGPAARKSAVDAFLSFVASITDTHALDPVEQGLLMGRLGELLRLPTEAVYDMLAQVRRARRRPSAAAGEQLQPGGDARSGFEPGSRAADKPVSISSAVQELLGLMVSSAECMSLVDDVIIRGIDLDPAWRAIYDEILNLLDEQGTYCASDVVGRCDDPAALDVLSRITRPDVAIDVREAFIAARDRLAAEFQAFDLAELERNFRGATPSDDADAAFRRFIAGRSEVPSGYRLHRRLDG
jgi:DNA primase